MHKYFVTYWDVDLKACRSATILSSAKGDPRDILQAVVDHLNKVNNSWEYTTTNIVLINFWGMY